MKKLDKKLIQETSRWRSGKINPAGNEARKLASDESAKSLSISDGVKLVSFAFKVPGKKPVKEANGLFLYRY